MPPDGAGAGGEADLDRVDAPACSCDAIGRHL